MLCSTFCVMTDVEAKQAEAEAEELASVERNATPAAEEAVVPPLSMAKLKLAERERAAKAIMEKTFSDRRELESFLVFEGGANTIRWRHGCPPTSLWKEAKLGDVQDSARMTPRNPAKLEQITRIIKATITKAGGKGEQESYLCLFYDETRVEVYVAAAGFDTARLTKFIFAYRAEKEEKMRVETARATGEQALLEAADEEARALRAAEAEGDAADAEGECKGDDA